ncbi:MAG: hypothetical protein ABJO27_19290 [Pseudoruegeria sp.]
MRVPANRSLKFVDLLFAPYGSEMGCEGRIEMNHRTAAVCLLTVHPSQLISAMFERQLFVSYTAASTRCYGGPVWADSNYHTHLLQNHPIENY